MENCPCGSDIAFADCCEGVITGTRIAKTAVELMRSRYSAFAKSEIEYLLKSLHPTLRNGFDRQNVLEWSRNSQWHGLEVLSTVAGGVDDVTGQVEFIAHFTQDGVKREHREAGTFLKEDGIWYFEDGKIVPAAPFVREEPRIGRNDPCPCGSGKKYKKCCGK